MISSKTASVFAVGMSLVFLACGGGDSQKEGGTGTTGTGGAAPEPTGCANFDNWHCQIASYQCFATCDSQQIACDGYKCARATGETSSAVCPDVKPQRLPDCGDCRAAFEVECK
jgi:hypothetical protein